MTSVDPVLRPGRPTLLTDETRDKVVLAIKAGSYLSVAATYAGISTSTLNSWLRRGRLAVQRTQAGLPLEDEQDQRCMTFLVAVTQAEAHAEVSANAAWRAAWADDWRAARDYLVRRHPERWAATTRVQISEAEQEQRVGEAFSAVMAALSGGDGDPLEGLPGGVPDDGTEAHWDHERQELVRVVEGVVGQLAAEGGDVPDADPGTDPPWPVVEF